MVAFLNDRFIEESKAALGITDLSIQRGYGIFDFFRTANFIPLFLDNHLDRFVKSAAALYLEPLHSREELKKIINEMIVLNKIADSGFKIILTGGYSSDGYQLASPNFIIIQTPVQMPGEEIFEKGIKIILHNYMREFPEIKSINYLTGVYLQEKIKQHSADDVLYCKEGRILEFPRSNIFAITKEGLVITPAEDVLRGITRMKVLDLARKKFTVEERPVTINELFNAAEVFLTGTTKRILPVLSIEDRIVGNNKPGAITISLYKDFLKMENSLIGNTSKPQEFM